FILYRIFAPDQNHLGSEWDGYGRRRSRSRPCHSSFPVRLRTDAGHPYREHRWKDQTAATHASRRHSPRAGSTANHSSGDGVARKGELMAAIPDDVIRYASRRGVLIEGVLGAGKDGTVYDTSLETAIKIH